MRRARRIRALRAAQRGDALADGRAAWGDGGRGWRWWVVDDEDEVQREARRARRLKPRASERERAAQVTTRRAVRGKGALGRIRHALYDAQLRRLRPCCCCPPTMNLSLVDPFVLAQDCPEVITGRLRE